MSDVKKLYRDPERGKIFGVCAGLSDYFDVDVVLVRIIWLFLLLVAGTGVLAYIIIAIVLEPKDVVLARSNKEKASNIKREKKSANDPFADYSNDPFNKK